MSSPKIQKLDPKVTGAQGGHARAKAMTKKQRQEAGQHAIAARWSHPRAAYAGELKIGDLTIECAVLENGQRVINDSAFQKALGRAAAGGQTYARRAAENDIDQLPIYVALKNLKPFIPQGFSVSTIQYIQPSGGRLAVGVDAGVIPAVCSVWLAARRAGALRSSQLPTAEKAEILMNGLATVGIIALIDEATGYQYDRDREALAIILEQYLGKELAAWVKTFPDDFYRHLCRLRGIPYDAHDRPQYFGHLTNDIVYSRLAPGVRAELVARNPRQMSTGRRKHHHHRWLSREVGHPELRSHLAVAVALMKVSPSYDRFVEQLDHVAPRFGDTLQLLTYDQMQPPVVEL